MHFVNSQLWLIILLILISVISLILYAMFKKKAILNTLFSDAQRKRLLSGFNPLMRNVRVIALCLALFFLALVLLDPRWGSKNTEFEMEGIDIVFVLDISRSMTTPDVMPTRLDAAKDYSRQMITQLLGNRMGLAAFAGYGFKVIPLTTDVNAALNFLDELSTDMIDIQGSNIEDALKKAEELFETDTLTHKVIVLFSDGEDMENSPKKQVKQLKEKGIVLYTLGMGTAQGGAIPLLNEEGQVVDYLKDDKGQEVLSRLDQKLLTDIARTTGGRYYPGNESSVADLSAHLKKVKGTPFGTNMYEMMQPQYQYFLLISILFLLIFIFLPENSIKKKPVLKVLTSVLILLILNSCSHTVKQAQKAYQNGQFDQALKIYQEEITKKPEDELLRFNEANCYFQLSNYNRAIFNYAGLTNSEKPVIRYHALYNMGHSLAASQDYESAVLSYKRILDEVKSDQEVYKRALQTYVYIKQMQNSSQNQQNQQGSQDKQDNQQDEQQDQDKNKDQDQNQQDKKQEQQAQKQQKPVSPDEIENLLNLIEQEEKKHLSKKDKPQGNIMPSQQKW